MIPVIAVRIVAKLYQVVTYLMGGLPKALLLLPTLPARQPCGAENDDERNCHHGFDKRKAALFFHARSVAGSAQKNDSRK